MAINAKTGLQKNHAMPKVKIVKKMARTNENITVIIEAPAAISDPTKGIQERRVIRGEKSKQMPNHIHRNPTKRIKLVLVELSSSNDLRMSSF